MSYAGFLSREALFWALVAGLFTGLGTGTLLWPSYRAANPARSRSVKLTIAPILYAVATASAAAGFVSPPALSILSIESVYTAGGALLVGAAAVRFPRAAGIPLLVIVGIVAVGAAFMVRGLEPVRERTVLAEIRILSIGDEELAVEVTDPRSGRVPRVIRSPSPELRATVMHADVPDPLFFLGADRFAYGRVQDAGTPFEPSAPLQWVLDRGWITLRTTEARAGFLNLLQRYELVVGPELQPALERLDP